MAQHVVRVAPLKTACINLAANPASIGDNSLVAAVTNGAIRVLQVALISTAANTAKFRSGTTDIGPAWDLPANGGVVLPYNEHGWVQTNVGEALQINLTGATKVAILLQYVVLLNTAG